MKPLFFFFLLFLSSYGHSMIIGPVAIEGTVVQYNKKTVTLKNRKGGIIKVSRKAIPKHFKLRTGAQVQALLKPEVITRHLNKTKRKQKRPGKRRRK